MSRSNVNDMEMSRSNGNDREICILQQGHCFCAYVQAKFKCRFILFYFKDYFYIDQTNERELIASR